jgi:hypothetical protein
MLDLINRMKITEEVTKKDDFEKPDVFKFTFYREEPKDSGEYVPYYKHYQITDKNFLDAKYSPEMQEQLGNMLLIKKRPKVAEYIRGDGSLDKAADQLAYEFASLPDKTGNSKYGEVGKNKAYHKYEDITKALEAAKKAYKDAPKEEKAYDVLESIKTTYNLGPTLDRQYGGPADEDPTAPASAPVMKPEPYFAQKETPKSIDEMPTAEAKGKESSLSMSDDVKGMYADFSDMPFKEAFNEGRDKGMPYFYWEGRLYHTKTPEEVKADLVGTSPKKEGRVEDVLEKAPEPLKEKEPEPLSMMEPEDKYSMLPKYPTSMAGAEPEPTSKSKVSDILKKTTEPDYDKMSFDEAFKKKRAKGEKEFPWRGKTYTTKYKEEL